MGKRREDFSVFLCYNDIAKDYNKIPFAASAAYDSSTGAHAPAGLFLCHVWSQGIDAI